MLVARSGLETQHHLPHPSIGDLPEKAGIHRVILNFGFFGVLPGLYLALMYLILAKPGLTARNIMNSSRL